MRAVSIAFLILALIMCAYLLGANQRLHRIANDALIAACADTERVPYPEVCGPLPERAR